MAQRVQLDTLPDYVAHCRLNPLISALRERKKIIIVAGAGMSAAAGIPTFDGMPVGSKRVFDMNMYNNDESTAVLNKTMCDMYHRIEIASPTQFHRVVATLADEGRLRRLYTQNIDGIDTRLSSLRTQIPLPTKSPWPTTIQLHGDLRTVRCQANPSHLSSFDPTQFATGCLPCCTVCQEKERLNENRRRARPISVVRPRVWLYHDDDYPDAEAISLLESLDLKSKPDAVLVVGTALKIPSARKLARDLCRTARTNGGFAAWVNVKSPPQELECFDLIVEGDCQVVAMHVSSWWLKECPSILDDVQIQELQNKCRLFIAKSAEAALHRALAEIDTDNLSRILQRHRPNDNAVDHPYQSTSKVVHEKVHLEVLSPPSAAIPNLPACWEVQMSRRLDQVDVGSEHKYSPITKIHLRYKEELETSFWRLKQGQYLNDEIINAYLELLRKSRTEEQSFLTTFYLDLSPQNRRKIFDKFVHTDAFSIFVPVHHDTHWTFVHVRSRSSEPTYWTYYDSAGGQPPRKFLRWLAETFPEQEIEEIAASRSPKQRNGYDCGLFVLLGIRLISAGTQHLAQTDSDLILPTFRNRVLAELLASSLDPSISQYEEFTREEARANASALNQDLDVEYHQGGDSTWSLSPSSASKSALGDGSKVPQKKMPWKSSPEQVASAFADESVIVKILKEAVAFERYSPKESRGSTIKDVPLAALWLMVSTEKTALMQRLVHYEFARKFWDNLKKLDGPKDVSAPRRKIPEMMSRLNIKLHGKPFLNGLDNHHFGPNWPTSLKALSIILI